MKLETSIPFAGFYETVHSSEIDFNFEMIFQDDSGECYLTDDQQNDLWMDTNMSEWGVFKKYAQRYTDYISEEIEIPLTFKELSSPREYNFTTDRIFAEIDSKDVQKIYDSVNKETLNKTIEDKFTSRSGFISFYDNSLADWQETPLMEWDANMIGTLLEVYIKEHFGEENLYEIDMRSIEYVDVYGLLDECIPSEIYTKYERVTT